VNTVLTFLQNNWSRLDLDRHGVPRQLNSVIITPRFRASGHLVFLLLPQGQPKPVLVAKVPRLGGASASLAREAANLRAVQASRPGGFDSIPRLIAYEEGDRQILVETALTGRLMDRATVRRDHHGCCQAISNWLVEIQQPGRTIGSGPDWFKQLIERPLRYFEDVFPLTLAETQLLVQTRELIDPLREAEVPLRFEHGDLSHPNIFLRENGAVGVVDWELAEPGGLPACDLFFFLTYAAFARAKNRRADDYLTAFQAAFFGRDAWARPYVMDYVERLRIAPDLLTPLFVLCWARYVANLLLRLGEGGRARREVVQETADWLRSNRYYALWQHTVTHANELHWHDLPPARQKNT